MNKRESTKVTITTPRIDIGKITNTPQEQTGRTIQGTAEMKTEQKITDMTDIVLRKFLRTLIEQQRQSIQEKQPNITPPKEQPQRPAETKQQRAP